MCIYSSEGEHDIGQKTYEKREFGKIVPSMTLDKKRHMYKSTRISIFSVAINARTIQRAIIYQQCKRLKKKIVPPGRAKLSPFFLRFCVKNQIFKFQKDHPPSDGAMFCKDHPLSDGEMYVK